MSFCCVGKSVGGSLGRRNLNVNSSWVSIDTESCQMWSEPIALQKLVSFLGKDHVFFGTTFGTRREEYSTFAVLRCCPSKGILFPASVGKQPPFLSGHPASGHPAASFSIRVWIEDSTKNGIFHPVQPRASHRELEQMPVLRDVL